MGGDFYTFRDALDLTPGQDGEFSGSIRDIPCVYTILDTEPKVAILRLRLKRPGAVAAALPERLKPFMVKEHVSMSVEDGLACFTLRQASAFPSTEWLIDCFHSFADALLHCGAAAGRACVACQQEEGLRLVYRRGAASWLCEGCLEKRAKKAAEEEHRLNDPRVAATVSLPIAVALPAVAWASVWLCYDGIFDLLGTEVLWVPQVGAFAVVGCAACFVALPSVFITRRSHLCLFMPIAAAVAAVLIPAAVMGEVLYVAVSVYNAHGVFDLPLAYSLLPKLVSENWSWYLISRAILVAGLLVVGELTAARRRVKLDLA